MSFLTGLRRSPGSTPAEAPDAPEPPKAPRRWRGRAATALACILIAFPLIAPDRVGDYTPAAFLRIPLEGLLAVPLLVLTHGRVRRIAAIAVGVLLGVLAILKVFDLGYYEVLGRPFDPFFDWTFLGPAYDFVRGSAGETVAVATVAGAALLAAAVLGLMCLAVVRLSRPLAAHPVASGRSVAVLAAVWLACAALGARLVPGVPVAAESYDRVGRVASDIADHRRFASALDKDAFKSVPASRLLTGLRGKDVLFAFVESYGKVASDDPAVDAVLDDGSRRLAAAGYGARTAYLTSPTFGGGSWLAHSTLLSGTWIDNQQRYNALVKSHRLTLTSAFRKAGWQAAAIMPGTTQAWPEGSFYGYQHVYDRWTMGYQGPRFNWGMPPDQYTLSTYQRLERAPGHQPVMTEIPMVTSHAPWAPTPRMIGWNAVGDGSAFNAQQGTGDSPEAVWKDAWRDGSRVRAAYMHSIEYSLETLISYVETYGDKNLVLVFLGDHQPATIVSGEHATHEVPITIVAKDPAVLNRISGWGWGNGLKPAPSAPVWRMDSFRDRFLTAFGSP